MWKGGLLLVVLLLGKMVLFSQTAVVSLRQHNVSLEKVITEIEKQADITFLYSNDQIRHIRSLNVNFRRKDLDQVLKHCLKGTGLSFRLVGNTVVLMPSAETSVVPVAEEQTPVPEVFFAEGRVVDSDGHPLPGVSIYIKNIPSVGMASGVDGDFRIGVMVSNVLVFSCVGYKNKELLISRRTDRLKVVLEESREEIEEVQVVGYGLQRRISVVGAVSSFNLRGRNFPVTSFSNIIAGNLAGVIGVQRSGEPGRDVSEFWIRGISTFGANDKALILIDGIERTTFDDLVPEDIESFSILKDATATAVYGARGGNGVVLINTRRGQPGRMRISVDGRTMLSWLPRLPEYVNAYDYARLSGEARQVRGEAPVYSPTVYDVIRHGLDPDLYPDVNWQHELLRKVSKGFQMHAGVSGGGDMFRYYIGLNCRLNDAAYRESESNAYHTNVIRRQYTFRTNLDINLTRSTEVQFNLAAVLVDMNRPGIGSTDSIWKMQAMLHPLSVPAYYSTGQAPVYGTGGTSPAVLLNESGYATYFRHNMESKLAVKQDLSRVLPGLAASVAISFDAISNHQQTHSRMPALYKAKGRGSKGELLLEQMMPEQAASFRSDAGSERKYYLETKLDYNFCRDNHRVGAMLLYSMSQYVNTENEDEIYSIPYRNQGIAGRLTYSFRDIYLAELNFGYNGSENFPKGKRFGFFPSVALGWVLSGYEGFQKALPFVRLLKLRYSWGSVGNDQISGTRFPYLSYVSSDVPGYSFGDRGESVRPGIAETVVGSENLVWEKALKQNFGVELNLGGKVVVEMDYFREMRRGIFMKRLELPDVAGIPSLPYGNVGRMSNLGFDGTIVWKDRKGGFEYEIRGNMTVTRNKIVDYDEPWVRYDYQRRQGWALNATRGYIALGYFRDSVDILNSPKHSDLVRPGDLKYKDVNGDGVINKDDVVPIGHSDVPRIQYGFAGSFRWKGWDLNLFFRGAGAVDFFYGGPGYFPFSDGAEGNVLEIVADERNRWIPAWYSGNPATENPDARFPRLSYGVNRNNFVPSTHWLADGSYLRLKTLEVGYSFPVLWLNRIRLKNLRLSVMGDNLHVWDKIRLWDPEQASGNGAVYPLTRSFLFNLQLTI